VTHSAEACSAAGPMYSSQVSRVLLNCSCQLAKYWIGLCSVLRPLQHSIGYIGDGFYRSTDPTNSIKVLKEKAVKENNPKNRKKTQITHMHTHTK